MKRLFLLMGLLINLCCSKERESRTATINTIDTVATIKIIDPELHAYDDVLTELVRHHFYDLYLGEEEVEKLGRKYIYRHAHPDTVSYNREMEKLRKSVEADTSRQSIICLSNEFLIDPWQYVSSEYLADSLNISPELKDIMAITTKNFVAISDSLTTPQRKYSASDFQPSAFRIASFKEFKSCTMGIVCFSKIFFNKPGNQAILYYEFHCGEKGSKGEILVLENKNNKWTIKKKQRIWIS